MSLLTIGEQFPTYDVTAVAGGDLRGADVENPYDHFMIERSGDHPRQWRVIYFWSRDADPETRREIAAIGNRNDEFADRHAQVLGVSVDNKYIHYFWRVHQEELKRLPFPILSDLNHRLAAAAGVLNANGVADHVTFVVDPENAVRHVAARGGSHLDTAHILKVLDELQPKTCAHPSSAVHGSTEPAM